MDQQNADRATDYSFEARWGDPVLDYGIAPIPQVFLGNYTQLGISPNQGMAIVHAFSYKWTSADPFPSMGTIAKLMGKSRRQVIRYFNDLEARGFLVKTPRKAENGAPLSSVLNFRPLLDACLRAAQGGSDTDVTRGSDTDDTTVVTPTSHEVEEVEEVEKEAEAVPVHAPQSRTITREEPSNTNPEPPAVENLENPNLEPPATAIRSALDTLGALQTLRERCEEWAAKVGYVKIGIWITRAGASAVWDAIREVEEGGRKRPVKDPRKLLTHILATRVGKKRPGSS